MQQAMHYLTPLVATGFVQQQLYQILLGAIAMLVVALPV